MPDGSNSPEVRDGIIEDRDKASAEITSQHPVIPKVNISEPPSELEIGHIRKHLAEEGKRTVERSGFSVKISKENFGRGDVEVVQIVPPDLTTEEIQRHTRKQIYIPGYDAVGKDEHEKLVQDLLELAKTNKDEDADPVIIVGVSFTGRRANDASLADGLPDGVEVTQFQLDKARDFIEVADTLVEGNNAEVMGFSFGGSIAQLAVSLGLRADTVGLFNSAGLYKGAKEDLLLHQFIPQGAQDVIRKATGKIGSLIKRKGATENAEERERSRIDRLKRSRVEHWGAYRSITHPLLGIVPDVQYVVANGKKDFIYPLEHVRAVLDKVVAPNVHVRDMEWEGHGLGGRNKPE